MRFEKLAALGALGATGGLVLLYALLVWLALPRRGASGIDLAHASVTWIALGVAVLGLVALHLALAHQLWFAPASRDSQRR